MKLSEIKMIYAVKTYNSYNRIVNEYRVVDFNNNIITTLAEKNFEKFVSKNLGKLARVKVLVQEGYYAAKTNAYIVKANVVNIIKKDNKYVAQMQHSNMKDLFDFAELEFLEADAVTLHELQHNNAA